MLVFVLSRLRKLKLPDVFGRFCDTIENCLEIFLGIYSIPIYGFVQEKGSNDEFYIRESQERFIFINVGPVT